MHEEEDKGQLADIKTKRKQIKKKTLTPQTKTKKLTSTIQTLSSFTLAPFQLWRWKKKSWHRLFTPSGAASGKPRVCREDPCPPVALLSGALWGPKRAHGLGDASRPVPIASSASSHRPRWAEDIRRLSPGVQGDGKGPEICPPEWDSRGTAKLFPEK